MADDEIWVRRLASEWTPEWLPLPWAAAAPVAVSLLIVVLRAYLLTGLGVYAVVWVDAWLGAVVLALLIVTALRLTSHTFGIGTDSQRFLRIVQSEAATWYGSNQIPDDSAFIRVSLTRWMVRRTVGLRIGAPAVRWQHACRWARLRELLVLGRGLAYWFAAAATAGALLWSMGLVNNGEPVAACDFLICDDTTENRLFAWEMADVGHALARGVPFLDLPATLGWDRPSAFVDDRAQNLLLLVLKLVVVVPVVGYLAAAFRPIPPQAPNAEPDADPVISAVSHASHAVALRRAGVLARRSILRRAATTLSAWRVKAPGEGPWSARTVATELRSRYRVDRGRSVGRRAPRSRASASAS